jgi:hypothetical protein
MSHVAEQLVHYLSASVVNGGVHMIAARDPQN